MERRSFRRPIVGLSILLLFLVGGCATDKDVSRAQKSERQLSAKEESRQEWEERIVENPWYVSSEYFRQKDDKEGFDVGRWWRERTKEENEEGQGSEEKLGQGEKEVKTEQRPEGLVAGLQKKTAASPPKSPMSPKGSSQQVLRFKVALLVLPGSYQPDPDLKVTLIEAAERQFAGHPSFLLVEVEEAEEILRQQRLVVSAENMARAALALGVYPAARLVVFVDRLALEHKGKKVEGRLGYALADGFSGRIIARDQEMAAAPPVGSGKSNLLEELFAGLVHTLEKRAAKYDWLTRVAMVEGNRIYLSAGKASGLKLGDVLAVYGPGREIVHPLAKISMGFQRGPYKGKVKIVSLFGSDVAEATVLGGPGGIEVNDIAALPDQHSL